MMHLEDMQKKACNIDLLTSDYCLGHHLVSTLIEIKIRSLEQISSNTAHFERCHKDSKVKVIVSDCFKITSLICIFFIRKELYYF